jgi:hypothetical protein
VNGRCAAADQAVHSLQAIVFLVFYSGISKTLKKSSTFRDLRFISIIKLNYSLDFGLIRSSVMR